MFNDFFNSVKQGSGTEFYNNVMKNMQNYINVSNFAETVQKTTDIIANVMQIKAASIQEMLHKTSNSFKECMDFSTEAAKNIANVSNVEEYMHAMQDSTKKFHEHSMNNAKAFWSILQEVSSSYSNMSCPVRNKDECPKN